MRRQTKTFYTVHGLWTVMIENPLNVVKFGDTKDRSALQMFVDEGRPGDVYKGDNFWIQIHESCIWAEESTGHTLSHHPSSTEKG